MARNVDPKCKQCRREGVKLFLKGDRCLTLKCAIERRNYPPGVHGMNMRRKVSDYGIQLREKQKARRMYGVLERQFRGYYQRAARMKGVTGENLLRMLEMRLDNLVYRMGLAGSRSQSRQLILHGHFAVNGGTVTIPSYQCRPGDKIELRKRSKELDVVKAAVESRDTSSMVSWLNVDKSGLTGSVLSSPSREEIPVPLNEQLIVELYSK
ncbi:MAG TPA: 30S ribosomal protein S4 [bacterium]|nr:30S ribosomal protein S4 [bacterium]